MNKIGANKISTLPVKNLILNKSTPQREQRFEHFLVPYYQRGYRWEQGHVEALLDDIHQFMESGEDNYCLQPIVVSPGLDEDGLNRWEVIDGQQRLITLYIIFKHIKKRTFKIIFGNRVKSNEFLENLNKDKYDYDYPDHAFMSLAHQTIEKWFEEKEENDVSYLDKFYIVLTNNVQVIWYETEVETDDEKIDIFNRLNIGKIPLTDAELIRALLLSKIKYGLSERESYLRQSEISNEWAQMEYDLRNDALWYFLTSGKESFASHIEFIFKILADGDAKKYSTYLWFEKYIKSETQDEENRKAIELWDKTKEVFAKFNFWFKDRTLYHHIGFLLINNVKIKDILENSDKDKSDFKEWLIQKVKDQVKGIDIENIGYGDKKLLNVLLLYNILSMEQLIDNSNNRFPFNHYKKVANNGGWSIEHIHAQQSEPLEKEEAIRAWIKETLLAIENISTIENERIDNHNGNDVSIKTVDLKNYISNLKSFLKQDSIDVNAFNHLKNELIETFNSSSVHDLDNLALLSKKDNSSLNNSIFPVKRNRIIAIEKEGKYVPHCTRNVFLKFYSNSDNQPYYWSVNDKKAYYKSIKNILKPYIC
ncbi:MAG: DUF262 domain-containing protein [Dysgonamonadaceae bacterium]|nr:DUF262 domain-containing protein [Dysgonamonadaceae bacterium]